MRSRIRKPFVVTSDYIGPDRRTKSEGTRTENSSIDVPNTLEAKARCKPLGANVLQEMIGEAMFEINDSG